MKKLLFNTLLIVAILCVAANVNAQTKREPIPKAPLAEISLSPCGYGFNANVYYHGTTSPIIGAYPYEIWLGGTMVDSGTISHGGSTPWVLSACTTYTFKFYGSWASTSVTSTLTVTTDGCGGVFIC